MRKTSMARDARGYAMVALLVLMAVMAVAMTVALPAWSTLARRDKEAELVFRGEQYARAIVLFQRKYGGAFPPYAGLINKFNEAPDFHEAFKAPARSIQLRLSTTSAPRTTSMASGDMKKTGGAACSG